MLTRGEHEVIPYDVIITGSYSHNTMRTLEKNISGKNSSRQNV